MYVVECPGCDRKFKVAQPVVGKQMKCSRCGSVFVGSSTEAPDAPSKSPLATPPIAPTLVPTPAAAAGAPRPVRGIRSSSSEAGPMMLVVTIVAFVGIAVLAVAFVYIRTHPTTEVRIVPAPGAEPVSPGRGDDDVWKDGPGPTPAAPTKTGRGPRISPVDPDPVALPAGGRSDPLLAVGFQVVSPEDKQVYVVGEVSNRHKQAMRSVTVTAWVRGAEGPSHTVLYVPAGGSVRYSINLDGKSIPEEDIRMVARGEKAPDDMLIWAIPEERLERTREDDRFVWRGSTRNPFKRTASKIEIHIDYFDESGMKNGSTSPGKLTGDQRTLGAGKRARFIVTSNDFTIQTSRFFIGRVVAKRF